MITDNIDAWRCRQPDHPALSGSTVSLNYKALGQRVDKVSARLELEDVRTLAIDLENGLDWVIADLAAMRVGITTVPVPSFFSPEQRNHLLQTAAVDAVLTDTGSNIEGFENAGLIRTENSSTGHGPCKITFTSGSTGQPRGVILSHAALERVADSIVSAMETIHVHKHLCLLPLATLLENVAGIYAPMVKGIETIVPRADETGLSGSSGLDIEKFAQCLTTHQPDSVILVPQLLMALVALTELNMITPDYLKMVAVGGGKVSSSLLEKSRQLGIPVYEGYGLSEACSVTTLNLPGQTKPGSVGRVLPHAQVRVNDQSELEVSGTLMWGYLGEPPIQDEWLATGDIAEIDDEGFIFIQGRKKNMFITAYGRNVNPEWIEAEVGQHPAIGQILVEGEGQPWNLALVWPRFETTRDEIAKIIATSNQSLPDYARISDFVLMEEPLNDALVTANGRLKRAAALATYQDIIQFNYQTSEGTAHGIL